jgi:hypothetical protein
MRRATMCTGMPASSSAVAWIPMLGPPILDELNMPVPTQHDRDMAEIDDLHGVVLIRLRTLQHAGARHVGASVREAVEQYVAAVTALAATDR